MTYHLLKTAAAVIVVVVCLKMLGEVLDAAREERDRYLRRTGVDLVRLVSVDNCLLFVLDHDVFHLSKKYSAENTVPAGEIRQGVPKHCKRLYPDTEFASLEILYHKFLFL